MSQGAELAQLREEIRAVTLEIVRLVGRRQHLAEQIGSLKGRLGLPVESRERKHDLLHLVSDECELVGVRPNVGRSLLNLLVGESERTQYEMIARSREPGLFKTVAVIGGGGAMGSLFSKYFRARGHDVTIYDIEPTRAREAADKTGASLRSSLGEAVKDADLVLVSVPMKETPKVIRATASAARRETVVAEISSLKAPTIKALLEATGRGVTPLSLHPLFGPGAGSPLGRRIAVIPVLDREAELDLALDLFPASHLFPVDMESHDEAVALTLGLVYYMNLAFAGLLEDRHPAQLRRLGGPSFRLQLLLCEALIGHDPAPYLSLLSESDEARHLLMKLAEGIKAISSQTGLPPKLLEGLRSQLAGDPWFSEAYEAVYELHDLLA